MPTLKLFFLGPPRFEHNGSPLDIGRRKAVALLAYLALSDQSHSRDALATLFWPEADQSRARGTLRRALSDLNKQLGNHYLETEGDTISLNPADVWIDVAAFSHLAQAGLGQTDLTPDGLATLTQAVALYRDDFMAGFTLPDSPAFDEWQFFQSENLRRVLSDTLDKLVAAHTAQGRYDRAIAYARRRLALDPLLEHPHRTLMQLYARTDQRPAALRQYQTLRQLLADEFGVEPTPDTTALYERIRQGQEPPHPKPYLSDETKLQSSKVIGETITSPQSPISQSPNLPISNYQLPITNLQSPPSQSPISNLQLPDSLRLVTLLFAGLSHAPDALWDSDPEATADQMQTLLEIAGRIAPQYGAQLDLIGGDGLQLIFGIPQLHEDDPERAIRAALELQAAAQTQAVPLSIGVSSGHVYFNPVNQASAQATVAVGPVVNLATRLQDRAAPGSTLVSAATYRPTQRAFAFKPVTFNLGHQADPVTAYEVIQPLPHPEKTRGIEGLPSRIVGRDTELNRLQAVLDSVFAGQGQIVVLQGEGGLGKTRLVRELCDYAQAEQPRLGRYLWLEGRCLEFRIETSYWPFIDLLQEFLSRRTGPEQDRAAGLLAVLQSLVEQNCLPAERFEEIAILLGNLLSLRFHTEWDDRLKHTGREQVKHQTFLALQDFLAALARQQPLILVFEDLHWADDLSLDLLTLLLDIVSTQPLLLLAVYRPEAQPKLTRLARLAGQKYPHRLTPIHLRELSTQLSHDLLESLLGVEALPGPVKTLILERSRGNPFFVEEAVRGLIDAGVIRQVNGCWRVQAEIDAIALPESIESVILGRVDSLAPPLKQVLRHAAVIGRLFSRAVITEVLPETIDLEQALWALEEAALIYQERIVPEVEYSFKHVLTQEAIYNTLSRRRRSELHQAVAEAIERLYPDQLREYYEQLVYHYKQTGATLKTIEYALKAGQKSCAAYFNDEAIHYVSKALTMLDDLPPDNDAAAAYLTEQRLVALTTLGEIYHAIGREAEAERRLRQAIDLAQQVNLDQARLIRLYYWLGEVLHWRGHSQEQIRMAQIGMGLLSPADAETTEAALMNQMQAIAYLQLGDVEQFQRLCQRTARFIKALPYTEELRPAYLHITISFYDQKRVAEALAWLDHIATLAEANHDLRAIAEVIEHYWGPHFERGDLANSTTGYRRVLKIYDDIGDKSRTWRYLGALVWSALMQGDLDRARRFSEQELAVAEILGVEAFMADSYINLGMVALCSHDWPQAQAAFEQALGYADQPLWMRWVANYCLGRAYLAGGNRAAALEQFQTPMEHFSPYVSTYRVGWAFRWWPVFIGILSGLDELFDDAAQFQTYCDRLQHQLQASPSTLPVLEPTAPSCWSPVLTGTTAMPLQQWHLIAVAPPGDRSTGEPTFVDAFDHDLAPGWRWRDPLADGSYTVHHGLELHAANGRDLWYINRSAPCLLRPVSGDFTIETTIRLPLAAQTDPATAPPLGGLVLWHTPEQYLRLVWGHRGPADLSFEGCLDDRDVIIGRGRLSQLNASPAQPRIILRLERRGDQVRALGSRDDQSWFSAGEIAFPTTGSVEVGLHAIGWIDRTIYPGAFPDGSRICFEQFTLRAG
ncbi:MAG: AAA family ATPase [Anaerolineae bacterium]|nr:AAA family ATPase [Anaerolineae bacterium]